MLSGKVMISGASKNSLSSSSSLRSPFAGQHGSGEGARGKRAVEATISRFLLVLPSGSTGGSPHPVTTSQAKGHTPLLVRGGQTRLRRSRDRASRFRARWGSTLPAVGAAAAQLRGRDGTDLSLGVGDAKDAGSGSGKGLEAAGSYPGHSAVGFPHPCPAPSAPSHHRSLPLNQPRKNTARVLWAARWYLWWSRRCRAHWRAGR